MLDFGFLKQKIAEITAHGEAPPGTRSEQFLSAWLAEEFENLGLSVEVQKFTCASWLEKEVELLINGKRVQAIAMPNSPSGYVEGELVHAGVGPSLNLSKVEGKVALAGMVPEDPDFVASQYTALVEAGALGVVFYDFATDVLRRIVVGYWPSHLEGPYAPAPIPAVAIKRETALQLLGDDNHYAQLSVKTEYLGDAESSNVVALSGEPSVLLTAHYDRWLSGVADDAVGVALLLLLAGEMLGQRDVGFVAFGAEEYGAPSYSAWYWSWGSRKYVEFVERRGELDSITAVVNLDLPVREPLTVSASGPEYRDAVKELLGPDKLYELDSAYFDSFSFSRAGVPALTIHSMWKYIEYYHTDKDTIHNIEWDAVKLAKECASKIVRSLVSKKLKFFRYDSFRAELLELLKRASAFSEPPQQLLEVLNTLEPSEKLYRELRRRLIGVVSGHIFKPKPLATVLVPQLLLVDDLEAVKRVLEGGATVEALSAVEKRWLAYKGYELPALNLAPLASSIAKMDPEARKAYLEEVLLSACYWLGRIYMELCSEIQAALSSEKRLRIEKG